MQEHTHQYDFVNTIKLRCKVGKCERFVILLDSKQRRERLMQLAERKELFPNGSAERELKGKLDG